MGFPKSGLYDGFTRSHADGRRWKYNSAKGVWKIKQEINAADSKYTGTAGTDGAAGSDGAVGAKGPVGPVGPVGPAGADGGGNITVATSGSPSGGSNGDLWFLV